MLANGLGNEFNIRYVASNGNLNKEYLCFIGIMGSYDCYSHTNGLRPVFLLNSDIKVTGGTGEKGSPYILGT